MAAPGVQSTTVTRHGFWFAERFFYSAMALAIFSAVFLGFADTFFLKFWFPEAAVHAPPEPFYMIHGLFFTAWLLLLVLQSILIGTRRVALHRRLGVWGAVLAGALFFLGVYAGLLAAHRPTGFVDIPIPALEFLTVPIIAIVQFAVLVALGIFKRRVPQSHKRFMLLATISVMGAGIVRWPFAFVTAQSPVPFFANSDLFQDLFLLPLFAWDVFTRGRLHSVTLWGSLSIIASVPLGMLLSKTQVWLNFAAWAVGFIH